MMRNKILTSFIVVILLLGSKITTYSQSTSREDSLVHKYNTEGPSKFLAFEFLNYVHFEGVENSLRHDNTLYFIDEAGSYKLLASENLILSGPEKFIFDQLDFVEKCEFKNSIEFKTLNINWLNKQLEVYVDKFHAAVVFYKEEGTGEIQVYKLIVK